MPDRPDDEPPARRQPARGSASGGARGASPRGTGRPAKPAKPASGARGAAARGQGTGGARTGRPAKPADGEGRGTGRPARSNDSGRPARPSDSGRPARSNDSARPARQSDSGRPARSTDSGRPARAGAPGRPARPATGGARTNRPANAAPRRSGPAERERPYERRPPRPVGPPLPPEADPALLPGDVRRELRGIPEPTAEKIAAHLVAAGQLVDDDPEAAYEHAKFAKTMASRVGAVREAVGVTAYRAGDFAAALTELKAARRITGLPDHLPLLADCERALGHPDRALAYAADPDRERLDRPTRVELAIVVSGARRDLGQPDAAVLALQGPELDSDAVEPWTLRLWYAYAEALLAAGRTDEAASWFTAVVAIDEDGETDAEERLAAL